MPTVTVDLGDSIASLAHGAGHIVKKVWDHPQNSQLKAKRKDPNVLAPGDEVFLPDVELKDEACPTDQKHKFKLTGETVKFRLQLMLMNEPRANMAYVLVIDGKVYQGTTGGDGRLEHVIPAESKGGTITLNNGKEEYPIRIGHLNPIDTISGAQQRLNNLGFNAGSEDGESDDELKDAISAFQQKYKLTVTGQMDGATRSKLEQLHP